MAATVVVWANACIITFAWYFIKPMRAIIGFWSLSQILLGVSLVLIALRGIIPDFLSIIVGGGCGIASQIATQEGLSCYMGKQGYLRNLTLVFLVLQVILSLVFTYLMPSVALRIVFYSLFSGFIFLVTLVTVRDKKVRQAVPPLKFLRAVMVFYLFLMIIRAVFAVWEGFYSDFMSAGLIQALIIIGIFCIYTSLSICLFWLISHKLSEEIQRMALTDALTNLANRRAMDEVLTKLISRGTNNIGIIIIDVDKFKAINDNFGHQAGDLYLRELSQLMISILKEMEGIFRYAGDEFVAIAQGIDYLRLTQIAKALSQQVADLSIVWEGKTVKTTISIGLAIADSQMDSWDMLIQLADEALYRGKNQGGNRVESAMAEVRGNP